MSYAKKQFIHFLFTLLVLTMSLALYHYNALFKDYFLFLAGMQTMAALEYILKVIFDEIG